MNSKVFVMGLLSVLAMMLLGFVQMKSDKKKRFNDNVIKLVSFVLAMGFMLVVGNAYLSVIVDYFLKSTNGGWAVICSLTLMPLIATAWYQIMVRSAEFGRTLLPD